ncbi:Hypothetical predicted protein [Olea europaea subsp. europaea]|uniref:Aminotransferase-like plant mobile domain-containing protein n=1 Tax=Olea europaea subsp. europaea TaxID=158383 RepID=A0A8S0SX86_OLEEU|nr:Hypothetical predicted protein [Olea europaea subsp. europaea]
MMGWSHAVERKSKNSYIKKKREEFDVMLTNENIVWQPYARLPDNFLPHYLVGQMDVALSRTILICFEKLAYHRPDLCPLKWNLPADFVPLEPSLPIVNKKRTASQKFDWIVRHANFVKIWDERRLNLIINGNGANIFDEGPSQEIEVRESHTEYQTPIGDFHGPSLGTSGGASPIDESHNEETPTEQHEASPKFA